MSSCAITGLAAEATSTLRSAGTMRAVDVAIVDRLAGLRAAGEAVDLEVVATRLEPALEGRGRGGGAGDTDRHAVRLGLVAGEDEERDEHELGGEQAGDDEGGAARAAGRRFRCHQGSSVVCGRRRFR